MEEYNILRMQDRLKEYLTRDRFIHTQGVMYTTTALAMCHGEDLVKAQVAGLLHDCAKCIPTGKKLKICKKNDIALTKWEEENEALLHAKVGVYIAKKKYGITDPEILNAIRYHTTGKADMTPLEKIVYIADYIEPGRYKAKNLPEVRHLAFQDLDETMYRILRDTILYLSGSANTMDPSTTEAYEYYQKLHNERKRSQHMSEYTSKEIAKLACEALADKKADDIKVIDISEVSSLADYFVIAGGMNRNQVQAMADNVEETLGKKLSLSAKQVEVTRRQTGFSWITET